MRDDEASTGLIMRVTGGRPHHPKGVMKPRVFGRSLFPTPDLAWQLHVSSATLGPGGGSVVTRR
jgi:hypothetical protein